MRRTHRRRTNVASADLFLDPYILELACKAYLVGISGDAAGVRDTMELARKAGIDREQLVGALDTVANLPIRTEETLDALVHRQYVRDAQLRPFTPTAASA